MAVGLVQLGTSGMMAAAGRADGEDSDADYPSGWGRLIEFQIGSRAPPPLVQLVRVLQVLNVSAVRMSRKSH